MSLNEKGKLVLALAGGGAFVAAFLLGLGPWRPLVRFLMTLVGPVAAFSIFVGVNPESGCSYECWERAGWALFTATGAAGWVIGVLAGAGVRGLLERTRATPAPPNR